MELISGASCFLDGDMMDRKCGLLPTVGIVVFLFWKLRGVQEILYRFHRCWIPSGQEENEREVGLERAGERQLLAEISLLSSLHCHGFVDRFNKFSPHYYIC